MEIHSDSRPIAKCRICNFLETVKPVRFCEKNSAPWGLVVVDCTDQGDFDMPLDAEQLGKLITTQAACLQLWVRSRCASVEDVVQDAFCRLAVQDPIPDNPVAWLYQVCRNLAEKQRLSDQRRREREHKRAQFASVARDPSDAIELAETLAAVERLDEDLREVLVARVWGQLSLEEIGQLCGVSTATAFRRYEAALKALRVLLELKCEVPP